MKKLFITFLCVVMVLAFMPVMAFAAEPTEVGANLQTAVDAAEAGDTLKLTNDFTLDSTVTVNKDLTIDLNGRTIKGNDVRAIHVTEGTLNLTGTGTVTSVKKATESTLASESSVIRVGDDVMGAGENAGLTLGSNVKIDAPDTYGITYFGKDNQTIIINGTVESKAASAISGNGHSTFGKTTVTVNEGAVLTTTVGPAIYHPEQGVLTINGGTITGATGIEMRAGELNVAGNATITATAEQYTSAPNGNGPVSSGGAIVIAQHTTHKEIKVNVANGVLNGAYALVADGVQGDITNDIGIQTSGGIFYGTTGVKNGGGDIVVAGGVFQDLEQGENVTISDTVDAAVTVETSLDMMKHLEIFGQENIQYGFDLFKEFTPEQIKAANIQYNITKAKEGVKFDVPDGIKIKNSAEAAVLINDKPLEKNAEITVEKTTEDNKQDNKPTNEVPKTGGADTMLPWLAVMAIAAGATVAMKRRKD